METAVKEDYVADTDHLLKNPERGMYFGSRPNTPAEFHTIVPQWLWLAPACDENLVWDTTNQTTSPVLKKYAEEKLDHARSEGYKILFRPRYDQRDPEAQEGDPPEGPSNCKFEGGSAKVFHAASRECQKNHITAIANMLGDYKDVIAFIHAGYLGNWGEWNTEKDKAGVYGPENAPLLYNIAFRTEIIDWMIDEYDRVGIMQHVEFRRPVFAKEVLMRKQDARIGFHNDCFMSNKDDFDTYENFDDVNDANFPITPDNAIEYAQNLTATASFGGETCGDEGSERWRTCSNMTGPSSEPASLHMNYLNGDHADDAVPTWENGDAQGNVCYDEIRRRLGYRFEVTRVEYPETVSAGETFSVAVDVVNTGWARLHKPRIAKLVLRRNVAPPDPDKKVHDLDGGEVEKWEPGEPGGEPPKQPLSITTQAPSTPGKYSVRLWIPDPDLQDNDPDEVLLEQGVEVLPKATINYAVKLATLRDDGENVFDADTGENDLGVVITVQ
jgi:hypothetical protein